jgi:hypothetical protein
MMEGRRVCCFQGKHATHLGCAGVVKQLAVGFTVRHSSYTNFDEGGFSELSSATCGVGDAVLEVAKALVLPTSIFVLVTPR